MTTDPKDPSMQSPEARPMASGAPFLGATICSGIGGAEVAAPWIDRVVYEIRSINPGASVVSLAEWSSEPVGTIRTFPSAPAASAFLVGFAEGRGLSEIPTGEKADD